jgi:hypothetical protein
MEAAMATGNKTTEIECVNKSDRFNPHERIKNVGGTAGGGWQMSEAQAIACIEKDGWRFYTDVKGKKVWVIVAISQWGHKYLKTEADGVGENNLLSLPECR